MIENAADFIRLVDSSNPVERRRAAWDEAPDHVWHELVANYSEMRFWVAHNRTIPHEIMRLLAADEDWRVRERIATKNACPPDILETLASDPHEAIASTVAGHRNTPTSALEVLARHAWHQVREKAHNQLSARGYYDA